jgi:hypothetical protein
MMRESQKVECAFLENVRVSQKIVPSSQIMCARS